MPTIAWAIVVSAILYVSVLDKNKANGDFYGVIFVLSVVALVLVTVVELIS